MSLMEQNTAVLPSPRPMPRSRLVALARHLARGPLVAVIARRIALVVPLLVVVSLMSFLLLSLTPGNSALQILGNQATPARVAALEQQLGLNQPLPVQYARWVGHALQGDLGTSAITGQSVASAIESRMWVSLSLIIGALVVMVIFGVILGMFSAVRGGLAGRFVDGLSLLGFALPPFWVGAILIEWFAVKIHALPAIGYVPLSSSPVEWLRSITLPVLSLSLFGVAQLAKQTREALLDVLASEHIRMAYANGIPTRRIFFVYALKNAGTRVLTVMGLLTIGLLGGTLFVETVFALPGLGSLAATSAGQQDVPMVQGITVFFTLIIIVVNLVTDVASVLLDPKVRL
jgi:peptide/nickel transport system permease protein